MINHPHITRQIASGRQRDLLAAASHHRSARNAVAKRPVERRRSPSARPAQVHCACS